MKYNLALLVLILTFVSPVFGQEESASDHSPWSTKTFAGLKFRSIGPAFMSGRIADIAIDPKDDNRWFIAVGSGGVWRTENAGVTWTPVFDEQSCYSIGCVTIDPRNSNTIWVGTGENVGGRHIGFGDGVYRSNDGGESWTNLGLAKSEHISKIIVHPKKSDVVWVASQGPLWSQGGERGLYKTTDGGDSWKRVLGDDHWTGVTDIAIDPRNPDLLYAATWQRHRTVAAYMGGGPKSGLHRSRDGGETWEALSTGLPKGKVGKIGLAISPIKPDTLYAAMELNRRKGAVYRSTDQGATWEKRSETVSGGTGPHYYQELYASPHQYDHIYLADVRMQVSTDGGKTFVRMKEKHKHSDNHALAFRMDDPDYLLCGSDGGLYESFDLAENWRFIDNLPVTQFYKIALDDAKPFYNVYGGTQDNSTEGGPVRTDNVHGIQNSDWRVVLDWDGHQPATEPGNPNILYAERQEGYLCRIDLSTGEIVDIMPQPGADEEFERFNWDSPILVSPHSPTRIYFASQRLWKSDNRGDEWTAISNDLTRNQNRVELPIMGETQSWDSPWDMYAMSTFNTITSISESPKVEGLLYVGTDDGLIQVSEDGGAKWRKIEVGALPGVPERAFINDIRADLFDEDTVYVALDNHKEGDFKPYLLKSHDRGRSWTSIASNLPDRLLVWRLVQDHVNSNLFFAATEFGLYFSIDKGETWTRLKGGLPTISFRDIKIHRIENDLVAASFGRGIYVFDDISVFRKLQKDTLSKEASLFPVRDAWWYFPRPHLGFEPGKGDQGAGHYVAPNPDFGATFTYYLNEDYLSAEKQRQKSEAAEAKKKQANRTPSWDDLEKELASSAPKIWLVVKNSNGEVIRRIAGSAKKGFHRVAWDLKHPTPNAVELVEPPAPLWGGPPTGLMAAPGTYSVTLAKQVGSELKELSEPQEFVVKPLRSGALPGASPESVASFWREYEAAVRLHTAMQIALKRAVKKVGRMNEVIVNSSADLGDFDPRLEKIRQALAAVDGKMNGPKAKREIGEKFKPVIGDRLFAVSRGVDRSTYGPTKSHRENLEIANALIGEVHAELNTVLGNLSSLASDLIEAGAPWIEGEPLPSLGN